MSIGRINAGSLIVQPSVERLQATPTVSWNFGALTEHTEALQLIDLWPEKAWDWEKVRSRKDLNMDFILRHKARLEWSPYANQLTENSIFSASDIENEAFKWSWPDTAKNRSLDFAFYRRHRDKPIDWYSIEHLTPEEMLSLAERRMNWAHAFSKAKTTETLARILLEHVSLGWMA
jgi:hypothetical protein